MNQILLSLLTGAVFGGAFAWLKLPIPAPATAAGVAGVAGVYLGMLAVSYITK
jgi:XapX domain-containing protein